MEKRIVSIFIFVIFFQFILLPQNILEDDDPFYSTKKYMDLRDSCRVKQQVAKYYKPSIVDPQDTMQVVVNRTYDKNRYLINVFSVETFSSVSDSNYSEYLFIRDSHVTINKIFYNGKIDAEYVNNDSTRVYKSFLYEDGNRYLNNESYFDSLGNNIKTIGRDVYGDYYENIFEYEYDFSFKEPKILKENWVHLNIKKEYQYDSLGREVSSIEIKDNVDTLKVSHFYGDTSDFDSVVYYDSNGKNGKYVSKHSEDKHRKEFMRYDDKDSIYIYHYWLYNENDNIVLDSLIYLPNHITSTHYYYDDSNNLIESLFFVNNEFRYKESYYYYDNKLPKEYLRQDSNSTLYKRIQYEYEYY